MNPDYTLLATKYPVLDIAEIEIMANIAIDQNKPVDELVGQYAGYVEYVIKNGFASGLVDTFDDYLDNKNLL